MKAKRHIIGVVVGVTLALAARPAATAPQPAAARPPAIAQQPAAVLQPATTQQQPATAQQPATTRQMDAPLPPADTASPAPEEPEAAEGEEAAASVAVGAPEASPVPEVLLTGYIDAGFAKAQGDGTSFPANDFRLPADYGVDTFATAVNSRGDVASTDSGDRFVNGFLPRSTGIGGHASFLLNVVNADLRYDSQSAPVFAFVRTQLVPRLSSAGDATQVLLDQAFGRLMPFSSAELAISVGKFDSVVGIEYIDNPSNIRIGITPSLFARYTTGTSVGAKIFYRQQIPVLWSALSLNVAATNSGSMIESLQGPDASLTGVPVASARVGYELNLPRFEFKLGASGLYGPRNDQGDSKARQRVGGLDARLLVWGLHLNAEYLRVDEESGDAPKLTGMGTFALASEFHARGFYVQAAYAFALALGALKRVTLYARWEQRHAWFEGFIPMTVQRATGGLRVDLWDQVALKGEVLINRERAGAPEVPNNVLTSSLVYTW